MRLILDMVIKSKILNNTIKFTEQICTIFVFSMADNVKLSPRYSKTLDRLQFGYIFIIFTRTDLVYLQ
jgi:hypothetical protein